MSGPEIRFEHVSRRYGAVAALDGIDLTIAGGSFVALAGASGSGKSTLLRTVNRLDESNAAERSGSVSIGGERVDALPPPRLRRRIGYVFQSIGLFPHMSISRNIAIGREVAGEPMTPAEVAVLLALVGLPAAFAARRPAQLSGGQQQRVGVARALANRPQVLLLDEPFGALDPMTRDALGREVRALHDRLGLTTVLVTHDMAEALLLADRILVMEAGRIVADGAPADCLTGRAGPAAEALAAVPREQARRIAGLA